MEGNTPPNIILLVCDACRLDYAEQHAPAMRRLGETGAWYTDAVAPGTWSLPSHASMFTGTYPHEHGVTQPSAAEMPTRLMAELREAGYSCYGVSGNGFTGRAYDFHTAFDRFRQTNTPDVYVDGLEMADLLSRSAGSLPRRLVTGIWEALTHDAPAKSLVNLLSVGANHVAQTAVPPLQRVPLSTFRDRRSYLYSGEKNTRFIERIVRSWSDGDDPFFLFANYMETHRPYVPRPELQRKHLGRTLEWAELVRLNDEVAAPWEFVRADERDSVRAEDVAALRALYAGEVETVDEQIGSLVTTLHAQDMLDDTLLVVTADHGELLGETDSFGRRRFGHEASIGHPLAAVPLIVSHGSVARGEVAETVSLKALFDLCVTAARTGAVDLGQLTSDGPVLCEYPALGDETMYERHPDVDPSTVRQRVAQDSAAAYAGDWRAVGTSDGERQAERHATRRDIEAAPEELFALVEHSLAELSNIKTQNVSEETASHLADLGYM